MSIPQELADACQLQIETITRSSFVWVVLRGEADIATAAQLDAALGALQLRRAESVHLHVKGLKFVDVTALRQLTLFAQRARAAGHTVLTCGAAPPLHRVAQLLSVQDELGLC